MAAAFLCLEGGGFRAASVGAGFFSGLLSAAGGGGNPTFAGTDLLGRFEGISTNSGSSLVATRVFVGVFVARMRVRRVYTLPTIESTLASTRGGCTISKAAS